MRRFLREVSMVVVVFLAAGAAAWAQATAQLNGRVTDESGEVLPGVTVTATQTDTTFARAVVTDASGNYAAEPRAVADHVPLVEAGGGFTDVFRCRYR